MITKPKNDWNISKRVSNKHQVNYQPDKEVSWKDTY